MSAPVPQSNFTVGEITHRMAGNITLDQYGLALTKARNFHILPQGPMRKRSGYFFITETKFQPGSGKETVAWIDFIFNKSQAYAIEAGDKYFRFYTNGGRVMSGPTPYEVVTPYQHDHVADLKFVQISDIIYIVHSSYPVYKLKRIAETNWTLTPVNYTDGPYLDTNKTDTTITWTQTFKPAGTGVPVEAWDLNIATYHGYPEPDSGIASYTFSGTTEIAVNGYSMAFKGIPSDGSFVNSASRMPRSWKFQGQKNGSTTWVTLDTRSAEADWIPGQTRTYDFANLNEVKYHAYRLDIDGNNGGNFLDVWELALKVQGITSTFTMSDTAGVNDGQGFKSTDVGRYIRFQGSDSFWRYVVITAVTNNKTIQGKFYGLWFLEANNTSKWRFSSYSATTGYPAAISLFEERLALGGSTAQPRTINLTRTGDFENFIPESPVQTDAGPISVTLTGESLDVIKWLSPGKGLFAGTAGGVTSISGGNEPVTYKNVRQVSQTNYGASSARPIRVGPALLFQAAFSNCIRELLYNFNDDAYDAPDITYLNEHLYRAQLNSAWLESPDEMALTPMNSGIIAALTYVRAQKVYGSTAYETDGTFEAVCVIPNMTKKRSDHYVVVQRIIGGQVKQYVEYAADPFEYQNISDSCFLDSALSYSGAPTLTLSGFDHLEGKQIVITGYADSEVSPKIYKRTVVGGSVTLDSPVVKAVGGLPYVSYLEILRSRAARSDQATSFGSKIRIDYVLLDLYRTANLLVNTPGFTHKDRVQLRNTQDPMDAGTPLMTGDTTIMIEGSWKDGGVMSVWSEDPLPAMIRVLMPTKDKEP